MNRGILIWFMVALGVAMTTSSCDEGTMVMHHISVLHDVTDEHIGRPEADGLIELTGIGDMKWDGIDFKYSIVSDVEYGTVERIRLEPENAYYGNTLLRKKAVDEFTAELNEVVSKQEVGSKRYSIIFPMVIREANRLARQTDGHRRHLVVYSDLMENSPGISLASQGFNGFDAQRSEKLWGKMESFYGTSLVDSLDGIEVHFIYRAKDYNDSKRFSTISGMYGRFLEERGAIVNVSGNL